MSDPSKCRPASDQIDLMVKLMSILNTIISNLIH